jgi:microsomal dipeptidase-like Zn-dependent dipeptidase
MDEKRLQDIKVSFAKGHMKIEDIQWLVQQLETSREQIRSLKTKNWYKVYEENLRLTNEIEALKIEMGVTNQ